MGRETKLLLGLLGLLAGLFVGVLSLKLLVPRPPAGAGPDVHGQNPFAVRQQVVPPPARGPTAADFAAAPPLIVASGAPFVAEPRTPAPEDPLAEPIVPQPLDQSAAAAPRSLFTRNELAPGASRGSRFAAAADPLAAAPVTSDPSVRPAAGIEPISAVMPPAEPAARFPRDRVFDVDPLPAEEPLPLDPPADAAAAPVPHDRGVAFDDGFDDAQAPDGSTPRATRDRDRELNQEPQGAFPPIVDSHLVAPGDSWWTVAERAYGDGRLYRGLYAWNRTLDPRVTLLPGTRLDIPRRDALANAWPQLMPPAGAPVASPGP